MRKFVLSVLFILTFFIANYAESATTLDGLITLDFYEDTQSGIENRWILDMTVNDIGGGIESIKFETHPLSNMAMDYNNQYNSETEYYSIGYYSASTSLMLPMIASDYNKEWIPIETNFIFYAMPEMEGDPIIGEFYQKIFYGDNLGNTYSSSLQLTGPVAFNAVPEPITMFLFVFGAFLLRIISRKK